MEARVLVTPFGDKNTFVTFLTQMNLDEFGIWHDHRMAIDTMEREDLTSLILD